MNCFYNIGDKDEANKKRIKNSNQIRFRLFNRVITSKINCTANYTNSNEQYILHLKYFSDY